MIQKLYSSDLEILIKLFLPEKYELHIFDPYSKLTFDKDFNFCEGVTIPKVLINLAPKVICYKHLCLEDFDFVFDFGRSEFSKNFQCKTFHYINNSNKTMRWIFPNDLANPTFLNLFNSASFKAKLISKAVQWGFKTPLKRFIKSGRFKIYHKKALKVEESIANLAYDNYSIFTGTVGPNRKLVLELSKRGKTTHFAKVLLHKASLSLLRNELRALYTLNGQNFKHLVVPTTICSTNNTVGIFSNIKPQKTQQQNRLTSTHLKGIQELYQLSYSKELIHWCSFYENTMIDIAQLKNTERFNSSTYMANALKNLWGSLNTSRFIPLATSHTDFTPWNTYIAEDKLYAYDWELSKKDMPMLFDVFHYIFQAGILIKRQNFNQIQKELDQVLNHPIVKEMIDCYHIDVELHYKLYLAINVSYYLNLYEKQEVLHEQAHWLVAVWKDALISLVEVPESTTDRQFFMQELMYELAQKPHAILKFTEEKLTQVKESSDLDIAIEKNDLETTLAFIKKHPSAQKVKVYRKSFMTTTELFFNDNSYLSLDFIYQFKRKATVLLNTDRLLANAGWNKYGIKVPYVVDDLEYTCLFYWLNNSAVPYKYQHFFGAQAETIKKRLKHKYNIKIREGENVFQCTTEKREIILNQLAQKKLNRGWSKLKNMLNYLTDTLLDLRKRKGFTITFSGVDGAGKSTAIESIAKKVSEQYRRKVVVLRHRPSILPILSAFKYGKAGAEERSINSLPRTGKNTSVWGSGLRFAYYFLDYLFGQFYVFGKYLLKGNIVLYDRYYYDFINDAKRSNIILPRGIVKMLFAFLLKPRLNVFLYASPEVILNRKKELDKEAILTLTADYKNLFNDYNKRFKHASYLQIENIDLDKTVATIMYEIAQAA